MTAYGCRVVRILTFVAALAIPVAFATKDVGATSTSCLTEMIVQSGVDLIYCGPYLDAGDALADMQGIAASNAPLWGVYSSPSHFYEASSGYYDGRWPCNSAYCE